MILAVTLGRRDPLATASQRGDRPYVLYDVGSAVQNLLLAATDLGPVTHLIASLDEAAVKRVLAIPADVRVVVLTSLAWPNAASYEEAAEQRLRERTRLPYDEIVFEDAWGGR